MAIKSGTSNDDTLMGTAGADTLYGLEGNDTLSGGTGNDILSGGDGNDVLDGGAGADSLHGGAGNDTFRYTAFKDADEDHVVDFAVGDRIDFSAVAGRKFIGNAQFNGVIGEIRYYDYYNYDTAATYTYIEIDADGNAKGDYALTVAGHVNLTQAVANSGILIAAANKTLSGTANADTLNGNAGNDILWGLGGNDVLNGGEGNDTLYGGNGNDTLTGGLGTDIYVGGSGTDTFRFTSPDEINGDTILDFADDRIAFAIAGLRYIGDTIFTGTPGEYRVEGNGWIDFDSDGDGSADKSVHVQGYTGMLQETAAGSNILISAPDITLNGTANADTLMGGSGNDRLDGWAGNDTLSGGMGRDLLYGGSGGDILNGGIGDDVLNGGNGWDTLRGGLGNDTLTGEGGHDTFKFASLAELTGDIITDLAAGDKIDLSAIPGLSFVGVGHDFTGMTNQVKIYDYFLAIDTDGDKSANYLLNLNNNQTMEETAPGSRVFQVAPNLTLAGTADADTLKGGNGDDMLDGLGGNDALFGGYGIDTLYGSGGSDILNGGMGSDTLNGGDGWDTLRGGLGNDSLTGGAGRDTFKFASLDELTGDIITDLAVGDKIDLSAIPGLSFAGVGNDFTGTAKQVSIPESYADMSYLRVDIDGDTNADYILSLSGDLTIEETTPGSRVFQVAPNLTLAGTADADTLRGGNGDDTLYGLGGKDTLAGGYGRDTLDGGSGGDILNGGAGNDTLNGGDGWDTLIGGLGFDTLTGGAGRDTFKFTSLAELNYPADINTDATITDLAVGDKIDLSAIAGLTFVGVGKGFTGAANQILTLTDIYDAVTYLEVDTNGDAYADYSLKLSGNLTIEETAPGSRVFQVAANQTLTGTAGADTLKGGNGDDTLDGLSGNDTLVGGYGNDKLYGGAGADTLVGGLREDTLTGGAGYDTFKFISPAEIGNGYYDYSTFNYVYETVTDFASGDKISLAGMDANINLAGDQAFTFLGANSFTGVAGELQYQYGYLSGDINGDLNTDFVIQLTGSPALTAADFVL
jgi:Ca2+-binding RTX toxin-like protein